jgi:ribose transport system permease protein
MSAGPLDIAAPAATLMNRKRPRSPLSSSVMIWIIAAVLFGLFSTIAPGFLTVFNLSSLLSEGVLVGFLAVGLTPVIISGNIDLSVGSVLGLAACLAVGLQSYGLVAALILSLSAGLLTGLVNGLLIEKVGINSFIVTLATMIGIRGLTFLYAGDQSISAIDDRFLELGTATVGPVSADVVVLLVFAALTGWTLRATSHGRNTYAIGGNRRATEDAGVPVGRHVVANMMLSGFAAALCGIAMSVKLGVAAPSFGRDYELWAITAVVLGGVRLSGGAGSVGGTLGAVLALAMLRNGLNLIQVSPFYIPIVMGGALIFALIADKRKRVPGARSE